MWYKKDFIDPKEKCWKDKVKILCVLNKYILHSYESIFLNANKINNEVSTYIGY